MDTKLNKARWGLSLGWGWNKGMGMSLEEKEIARHKNLLKYNNKPERKLAVKLWHQNHKERVGDIKQKYAKSDRGVEMRRVCGQRRIARERALSKDIDMNYWKWLCERLHYQCQMCGKKLPYNQLTIDHQLAINRGGDNDNWNLQPLCRSCNSSKQDRLVGIDNLQLDLAYGDWLCQR